MQKGKTSKFVPKLGLVLWMLPLSSWAVSGTIPEANSALTSYAHEAREIDAIAQSAKKRTVTGTITDASDGTPIIGANIVVKGSQTGVISDLDGNYSIEVSSKDVLVISFIGYKTREVPVVDLGVINVKLKSDNEMLDEVVVVGAGTQKKVSVTGSITSVKGSSLVTPTSSLTNALAGKLSGVIAKTSSGAPGEAAEFYIRGIGTFGGRATPLIMLDDVEISAADLNNIPAETIESFSILKDASATAIYGARGANGVMLITTKSGRENERTQINVTVENAFNVMTNFPDFVDGATWMTMYNEAQVTRTPGITPKYTQEQIENTRLGTNPYMYPSVKWNDVIFKNMAMSQRANINVQGGGSRATYYMSIQANHDSGLLNTRKVYSYNNNINNWSYNFQNNIKYKLTSTTTVDLRMNAQIRNNQGPNYNTSDLFNMALTTNPINFPVTFPAQEGDTVHFAVSEDVVVGDVVAIPRGMEAEGTITNARKSGMFGKDGKIEITYHTVRAADNTPVPLIIGEKTKEEYKRTAGAVGASAAGAIILGPVGLVGGLFVHGNDVDIPVGTEMLAEAKDNTEVMGFRAVGTPDDMRTADMAASGVVVPAYPDAETTEPTHETGYYGDVTPVELGGDSEAEDQHDESEEVVVTITPSDEQVTGDVHE